MKEESVDLLSEPTLALRRAVAHGIAQLRRSGVTQAEIARTMSVSDATVSRWANCKATLTWPTLQALASGWPGRFERDHLAELFHLAAGGGSEEAITVGVRLLADAEAVYTTAITALQHEPDQLEDRVIRHSALHLDRRDGTDPVDTDITIKLAANQAMRSFAQLMGERAAEGWTMRHVTSAGTLGRVATLRDRVARLDGANVEVRAYPVDFPPILNVLVIGNRDVFMAVDHPRWERPATALLVRSRQVAAWASAVFELSFTNAPFVLRTPLGVNDAEIEAFAAAVVASAEQR